MGLNTSLHYFPIRREERAGKAGDHCGAPQYAAAFQGNWMTSKLALSLVYLMLSAASASAFSAAPPAAFAKDYSVQWQSEAADSLVRVESDTGNSTFLPGYEYLHHINVIWDVPPAALQSINAKQVVVYVKAEGQEGAVLDAGSGRGKTVYFELVCNVREGACNGTAPILKRVDIYSESNSLQASLHSVHVAASLSPWDAGQGALSNSTGNKSTITTDSSQGNIATTIKAAITSDSWQGGQGAIPKESLVQAGMQEKSLKFLSPLPELLLGVGVGLFALTGFAV